MLLFFKPEVIGMCRRVFLYNGFMAMQAVRVEDRAEPVMRYERTSRSIIVGTKVTWYLHREVSSSSFQAR